MLKSLIVLLLTITIFPIGIAQVVLVSPKNKCVTEDTEVLLSWNPFYEASSYTLQVAKDSLFSEIIEQQNILFDIDYQPSQLMKNKKYFWRVKANNSLWSAVYSFTIVDFRTWPELEFMLNPENVVLDVNSNVEEWLDAGLKEHNFSQQDETERPSVSSYNGMSLVYFSPSLKTNLSGGDLSHLSEGEVFVLNCLHNYPPSNALQTGMWTFGSAADSDHFPWSDKNVYSGFGRSIRFNLGKILDELNPITPFILNISSADKFRYSINKEIVFSSTNGSVSFTNPVVLGKSAKDYYFNGALGQIIMFNTVLSDSLRNLVHSYFQHKYAPPVNLGRDIIVEDNLCGFTDTLRAGKYFISYEWSDGSTADSLVVNEAGKYWVQVVDVFGNVSSDTIRIQPKITYPSSTGFCEGETITWEVPDNPYFSYQWSSGEMGNSIDISSSGDYYVTIIDTNNCSFVSETISFSEDTFSSTAFINSPSDLCSGNTISLYTENPGTIDYLWSTGETTSSIEVNSSGTYSVFAENENGCIAEDELEVTIIGDAPLVALDLPTEVCLNETFSFSDASTTTDGSDIISWSWSMGDATQSTEEGGEHVYHQAQDYTVELTIETSSGCSQTGEAQITVHSLPALDINTTNYCAEREVQFFGGQTTPTLISSWDWGMGDGNLLSGEEITHVYASAGDYEVVLVGTDIYGCKDTVEFLKTIYPLPEVSFAFEEICEGEVVQFHNTSQVPGQGNISAYQWDFGDGTSSSYATPQKPYTSYGEYEVVLTATSEAGCSADSTQTLKVHAFPTVNHQLAQNCAGISALLEDQSYVPNGSIAVVDWSINGQPVGSGFQFTHVFPQEGTYTLKQDVHSAFGCRSVKEYTISIEDYLAAGFTIDPEAFVTDFPIAFENTSEGASQYTWHFGDFATSNTADTNFIFTEDQVGDSVQVTLVVDNEHGCTDSTSLTLPVLARGTDLALTQLFVQENGGFMQIGVELQNLGTTPIENVALTLHKTGLGTLKEIWEGQLLAGEKEIYVFTASPTANVSLKDSLHDALCVSGHILSPVQFKETNFSNNEICRTPSTGTVLLQPAPNPVENVLTLKVVAPKATKGEIIITDHLGRVVARIAEQEYAKGLNKVEIPTWNWSAGVYKIRWEGEEKVVVSVVKK